jgi:hypothetical protein
MIKKESVTEDTLEFCFLHTQYHYKNLNEMILTTLLKTYKHYRNLLVVLFEVNLGLFMISFDVLLRWVRIVSLKSL